MTYVAPRTCTEILHDDNDRSGETPSRPLEEFRSESAYVLLGDPGAGKTTAFKDEVNALGSSAAYIPARDFLTLSVGSHPEWRDKTLFIDGLDEVRVGSSDVRTPFDAIRSRLDELGKPDFRISCREADWLGEFDRTHLAKVSPQSTVTTLRLDPLTESDVESILNAHPSSHDAQDFVSKATGLGIEGLLANPQTLKMLADVVGGEEGWPEGRLDTFEKACRQMAEEFNEEHVIAEQHPPLDQTLGAAGHLCAVQLISGTAGFSLIHNESNADYLAYDACGYESPDLLRQDLSSRLFKGAGVGHFVPVHRHIAEFLAGRHLAKLIDEGLSTRRVLSLMTGEDGVVVTELRGLSAWLAAHCRKALGALIKSDPIGVGLYGDIRGFSTDDKRKLIMALSRQIARLGYSARFATAFGPLASPEMESTFRGVLAESRRDRDHQLVVEVLLSVLQGGTPLPRLAQILLDIVRDETWWPKVTRPALDAFIHASEESPNRTSELRQLLADIRVGRVTDPDNELLGTLLTHLYPREIRPSEVWDYLGEQGDASLTGRYRVFWDPGLLKRSSDGEVAELLDHLKSRLPGLRSALESRLLDELPTKLLARGLWAHGDEIKTARLYNWLSAGAFRGRQGPRFANESIGQVRSWLERRPEIQKDVLLEGLFRCPDDARFSLCSSSVRSSLHDSDLSADFGLWCLDRAVELVEKHPQVSKWILHETVYSLMRRSYDQGLSWSVVTERIRGHQILERWLADLLDRLTGDSPEELRRTAKKFREQDERRREHWIDRVRSNADALRENRALPSLLHDLARAYFGQIPSRGTNINPELLVREQLCDDGDLTEAAMTGLRGTICRDDVPEVAEVIRLRAERRMHPLTLPFIAALFEIERTNPEQLRQLSHSRIRKALAFNYCTFGGMHASWYVMWLDSHSRLVADILVKYAASAIRSGEESVSGLAELAHSQNHAQVARLASLPLLRAFPLRCTLKQVGALDFLLWAALQHADEASLRQLIEEKLSRRSMNAAQRVHWLAAGVFLSPDRYLKPLEDFLGGRESRIRQLAAFFCPDTPLPFLTGELQEPTLRFLIKLIGTSFGPVEPDGWITLETEALDQVQRMIQRLASMPGQDATQALEALSSDAALHHWHDTLIRARDSQRVIHRDAAYCNPSLKRIRQTLSNKSPANPADLAALLVDQIDGLADQIRTGNTDDWRQYWNENPRGRPVTPKHEESCRDALLSGLRMRLPDGVDAQPEGQYAGDKRADIRVSHSDFNVPVEIKKSTHRDLWSAARNQLIAKYTTDPATGGHGVYLVLWFGQNDCPPAPSGPPPSSAEELRRRLQETLTEEESRKISVCVVDVSPPGQA